MNIKSVELCDFRNYSQLNMHFHEGTNLLYGNNAQGKTNVLESLYLCSTTKSHKGSKDKEVIRMGMDESHLRMTVEKGGMQHVIDMHLKRNRTKGIAIDGVPIRKSSELIGLVNIVFFSPEDLSIIKNGPAHRRRFIDMELSQLDKIYLHNLTKYNKIIVQRNNLLKQISFKRDFLDTLSIWDEQLEEYGKKIIERRELFIKELNVILNEIHTKLSGGKEELIIQYNPNAESHLLSDKINYMREKDIMTKSTNIGPHRDDIVFLIKNNDVRKFGSQGQQRTAALSLKLAEIELLKRTVRHKPILLLDDVLSELDRNRQNYLLDSIKGIQTIITCTGLEEFVNSNIAIDKVFCVSQGMVEEVIHTELKNSKN